MKLITFAAVLLMATALMVSGEVNDSVKNQIVVHTPLQNYEQPSLRDYEECTANRKNCLEVCNENEKCEAECPICPELSTEPLLVQGVNDTNYVPPALPPLNTTNIIRLTNEIRNIVKNDIQARNEVNVQVHQNVSQLGGRFGLGYNEQGSCCYVVRRSSECELEEHCQERSRQRVCGERCQAREMIARRVVQCPRDQTDGCQETVEYVPRHRKSKAHHRKESSPCRYTGNTLPYVTCDGQDQGSVRVRRASCQRCLDLPYGYILQNGLPAQCAGCFQGFASPVMAMPIFYSPYGMPNFGYNYPAQLEPQDREPGKDDEMDIVSDSGWVLKSQKCQNANGELEDCPKGNEDGDGLSSLPPAHLEQGKKNDIDYGTGYEVPAQRRRRSHNQRHNRRKFVRSLYSRRNGH